MFYFYKDSIITVRPGIGGDNYATCILNQASGSWHTVKSPEMPRTTNRCDAINSFHAWAETQGLKKADCGCCWHCGDDTCVKYNKKLKRVEDLFGVNHICCEECFTKEKGWE